MDLRHTRCVGVAIAFLLSGCLLSPESIPDPDEDRSLDRVSIAMEESEYNVTEALAFDVHYHYVNDGNEIVYVGACIGHPSETLEKYVDGEWVPAYAPFCEHRGHAPIEVAPGERYAATVSVKPATWSTGTANASWRVDEIEGTYRVIDVVYAEWDRGKFDDGSLHAEQVHSNAFDIRLKR